MRQIGSKFYNAGKHRLLKGEKLIGSWAQLCSPMSAEILARSGMDFLLIDLEHGPGDVMTLLSQLQAVSAYPVMPIVRAPWNDFVAIKKILDVGAYGIHVPYVNTAKEAREAVQAVRYAPEGIRGIAGSPRACGYGVDGMSYFQKANEEILLYIALETEEAIDHLEEIIKVDGVDGIFIGPMDLAACMGYLGNPGHPAVKKKIEEAEKKVLGSGKFLGTVAGSYEDAREKFKKGYQYIVAMSDSGDLSKMSYNMACRFHQDFQS
ncbi:MAG: aldolase/citrate lyase family protein [Lachnoclostridium edouardi]|uniref:HpcH/HpaI aldolase family protein n=1 Tax=Lachnoclostridium edouardi TaxID=1926283 RepID=UPI0026DD214C|nr:aldolase/citrate lyase family protein [Lachnoclostridium edouardi]MDO4277753.1 aldolase/citrate lyase family protein [Lachnoclostridium edouardi]